VINNWGPKTGPCETPQVRRRDRDEVCDALTEKVREER